MAPLTKLPLELLYTICSYSSAPDIIRLLSCCRELHCLSRKESIWRELAGRFGISTPLTTRYSLYTVYSRLLHLYAPLIGIWASDYPFKGRLLEFRFDPGNEQEGPAIIGEAWRFPPGRLVESRLHYDDDGDLHTRWPHAPTLVRVLRIVLASDGKETSVTSLAPTVRITCGNHEEGMDDTTISFLIGPPMQMVNVEPGREPSSVAANFPPSQDIPWLDTSRQIPRTRVASEVDLHPAMARTLLVRNGRPPAPVARSSITPAHGAPEFASLALQIRCARNCHSDVHVPHFGTFTVHADVPRYWPIRAPAVRSPRVAAALDAGPVWDPVNVPLDGLWLGDYGMRGTEVLYLEHDAREGTVRAWKMTGDINVPRGAQTWMIDLRVPVCPDRIPSRQLRAIGEKDQLFMAQGTVAGIWYWSPSHDSKCTAAIVGKDEIKLYWEELHGWRVYVRYNGVGREN